jgi:hypothetical protein
MSGRPLSSYAYPRVWRHLEELGFLPSHRGLIKLAHSNSFRARGTQLTNRSLEKKFKVEAPALADYDLTHDLLALINHHRQEKGLSILSPSTEIVRFDHRIIGLSPLLTAAGSEHTDPTGDLAKKTEYSEDTIRFAALGRLLPQRVCIHIVGASGIQAQVVPAQPMRLAAPVSDPRCLRSIFQILSV